jgi:hypothetical protein
VLEGIAGVASISGDVRSIALDDRSLLFVAGAAETSSGHVDVPGFVVARPAGTDCAWSATSLGSVVAASPIRADATVSPLDLVATDVGLSLYYTLFVPDSSMTFGVRSIGVGIAPRDAASGRFVPSSELLWSADRAPYGSSALRVGDYVYAYGCVTMEFLGEDCYVARVPVAETASIVAYEYFDGATWTPDPDASSAIVRSVGPTNVRFDAAGARFVMTYVPPLGTVIVARTAIAPEGPWSEARTLATCDLTGADGAFCGGGEQHALDGIAPGSVAVTYSARAFVALDAGAAISRLVVLPLP